MPKEPIIKDFRKLLNSVCQELKITILVYLNKSKTKLIGCQYNSPIISIFYEKTTQNYSVLVPFSGKTTKNIEKKFPFYYTENGNLSELISSLYSLMNT